MSFYNATYLFLLFLVPLVFIASWLHSVQKAKARKKFADSELFRKIATPEPGSRITVRVILTAIALALIFVAFARPQGGEKVVEEEVQGIDIVLAIDVSRSMNATDLSPNRLAAIKSVTRDFIDSSYGDRIGVVAFAGDAIVVCPLTTDHGAVLGYIDRLSTNEPIRPGTGIGNAIQISTTRLKRSQGGRVIILLTDGENNKGIDVNEAVKVAVEDGIRIYTVGIGTSAGAPLPDDTKSILGNRYRTDDRGNPIMVGLDTDSLRKIAHDTNGRYFQVTNQQELRALYSNITHENETLSQSRRIVRKDELAPFILILAALFLIMESLYAYITPAPDLKTAART